MTTTPGPDPNVADAPLAFSCWREAMALRPNPANARTHTDAEIDEVCASIEAFGWTNPLLCDGDGVLDIVAGHRRRLAARRLHGRRVALRMPSGAPIPAGCSRVINVTGWDARAARRWPNVASVLGHFRKSAIKPFDTIADVHEWLGQGRLTSRF